MKLKISGKWYDLEMALEREALEIDLFDKSYDGSRKNIETVLREKARTTEIITYPDTSSQSDYIKEIDRLRSQADSRLEEIKNLKAEVWKLENDEFWEKSSNTWKENAEYWKRRYDKCVEQLVASMKSQPLHSTHQRDRWFAEAYR